MAEDVSADGGQDVGERGANGWRVVRNATKAAAAAKDAAASAAEFARGAASKASVAALQVRAANARAGSSSPLGDIGTSSSWAGVFRELEERLHAAEAALDTKEKESASLRARLGQYEPVTPAAAGGGAAGIRHATRAPAAALPASASVPTWEDQEQPSEQTDHLRAYRERFGLIGSQSEGSLVNDSTRGGVASTRGGVVASTRGGVASTSPRGRSPRRTPRPLRSELTTAARPRVGRSSPGTRLYEPRRERGQWKTTEEIEYEKHCTFAPVVVRAPTYHQYAARALQRSRSQAALDEEHRKTSEEREIESQCTFKPKIAETPDMYREIVREIARQRSEERFEREVERQREGKTTEQRMLDEHCSFKPHVTPYQPLGRTRSRATLPAIGRSSAATAQLLGGEAPPEGEGASSSSAAPRQAERSRARPAAGDTGGRGRSVEADEAVEAGEAGGAVDDLIGTLRARLGRQSSSMLALLQSWDTDGSGTVDATEFRKAVRYSVRSKYSDDELDRAFEALDADRSGTLSFAELKARIAPETAVVQAHALRNSSLLKKQGSSKLSGIVGSGTRLVEGDGAPSIDEQLWNMLQKNLLRVVDLFRQWDEDGSGEIDRDEFAEAIVALGYEAPREDVDRLFDRFDRDASGTLSYRELQRAIAGRA